MINPYLNKLLSVVFLVWAGMIIGKNAVMLFPDPNYDAGWWHFVIAAIMIAWASLNIYVNYKVGPK